MKSLFAIIIISGLYFANTHAQSSEPEDLIVDEIECSGNQNTNCKMIKHEIYLSPGEKVNEEELKNAKIRLQLLNLFKSVNISLKKSTERGHVILNVEVIEASPYFSETLISAHYSSNSGARLGTSFKLGNRNLFGLGKILQATIVPTGLTNAEDKTYLGNLEYIDPHLFGHKKYFLSGKLSHYLGDQVEGNSYTTTAIKNFTSVDLYLGYRIFDFSYIGLGVDKSFSTQLRRNQITDSFQESKSEYTDYVLKYGWNSEDDTYFPTEGTKFDLEYNKPAEDDDREFARAEFKQNFSLNSKNVLALYLIDNFVLDFDYYHSLYVGLEWAHQLRGGPSESSITDVRFFIAPSINYFSNSSYLNNSIDTGVLIDTKSFGIIKFTASLWGL